MGPLSFRAPFSTDPDRDLSPDPRLHELGTEDWGTPAWLGTGGLDVSVYYCVKLPRAGPGDQK